MSEQVGINIYSLSQIQTTPLVAGRKRILNSCVVVEKWLFIHRQWFLITFSKPKHCRLLGDIICIFCFEFHASQSTVYPIKPENCRVCHGPLLLPFGKHGLSKCPEYLFQKTTMGLIHRAAILVPSGFHLGSILVPSWFHFGSILVSSWFLTLAGGWSRVFFRRARRSVFGEDHLLPHRI